MTAIQLADSLVSFHRRHKGLTENRLEASSAPPGRHGKPNHRVSIAAKTNLGRMHLQAHLSSRTSLRGACRPITLALDALSALDALDALDALKRCRDCSCFHA